MDKNGYNDSIMKTEDGTCFACGFRGDTARHEIFPGRGNREICKAEGLWVALCPRCHEMAHLKFDGGQLMDELKRAGYAAFVHRKSREEFYELFRRYYE